MSDIEKLNYCGCGCGNLCKNRFVLGHYTRLNPPMHNPESAKKLSESKKGVKRKPFTEEAKRNMSVAGKTKIFTEEHCKNLAIARRKRKSPMLGKTHTEETKKKLSERIVSDKTRELLSKQKRGDKNPQWCGGKSFEPYPPEFNKFLKLEIRERDKYSCQHPDCSYKHRSIPVHHIDYDKNNCRLDNLICLCRVHHNLTINENRDYWISFYQQIMMNIEREISL